VPVGVQRRWTTLLARANRIPRGTAVTRATLAGIPAERVEHGDSSRAGTLLYLHGGGYVIGSPRAERTTTANLARATGTAVYALDYRLAPENPFPAALDDTVAAYQYLVERENGIRPLALGGDSAGGALAVACAIGARDQGLPLPAALVLICPWLDLTHSGSSIVANARREPILKGSWLEECARMYLAGTPADDPRCSPLFADLAGLPPMLIQAAGDDLLLSEAERFAERAEEAGVAVELQRFDGLWHDFHLHAGALRSSDAAFERIGAFLRRAFP
jgi:monoterpene epsilon-lactone hydrolase